MRPLLILILSCLSPRLKEVLATKKLSNSEMSKNLNTKTKIPGKKVPYHIKTLKNLRTSIALSKVILITMMAYSGQLGKSIMIKKLQKSQLTKNATQEILILFQVI